MINKSKYSLASDASVFIEEVKVAHLSLISFIQIEKQDYFVSCEDWELMEDELAFEVLTNSAPLLLPSCSPENINLTVCIKSGTMVLEAPYYSLINTLLGLPAQWKLIQNDSETDKDRSN